MSGDGTLVARVEASSPLLADLPPNELVPGDLATLESVVTSSGELADQLTSTARAIDYIELYGDEWTGVAADVYFVLRDDDTTLFKRSSQAFDQAANALRGYTRELVDARGRAEKARHDFRDGLRRQRTAEVAAAAPGAVLPLGPPPPDPYGLDAAADLLLDAWSGVERAAQRATRALHDAARLAPDRSYLTRHVGPPVSVGRLLSDVLHAPGHLAHGLGKIGKGTTEGLSTTGSSEPLTTKHVIDTLAQDDITAGLSEAGPATIDTLSLLLLAPGPEDLAATAVPRIVIEEKKYRYFFGLAKSSAHNMPRSLQNLGQLARIGVHVTPEGRAILSQHFHRVGRDDTSIVSTFRAHGSTFQVRESLLAGPGGFLKIRTTWEVTDNGLRLTTVNPLGGGR